MAVPADDNDAITSWITGAGLFDDVEVPTARTGPKVVMPWQGPASRIEVRVPVVEGEPPSLVVQDDVTVDVSAAVAPASLTLGPEIDSEAATIVVPAQPDTGRVGLGDVRPVIADLTGKVVAISSRATNESSAQWFENRPGSVTWADGLRTARITRPVETDLPAGHRAILHASIQLVVSRAAALRTTQTDRGHVVVATGADGEVVGHALVPDGATVLRAFGVDAPWPGPGQWQWTGARFEPLGAQSQAGSADGTVGLACEPDCGVDGPLIDEW